MSILTANGKCIDSLIGQKFGMLLVVDRDTDTVRSNGRKPNWLCLCECGARRSVARQNLTNGYTTNCGCVAAAKMPKVGNVYGLLTVLSRDSESGEGLSYSAFICQCRCGVVKSVKTKGLLQGYESCGCLRKVRATEATLKDLTGLRIGRWLVLDRSIEVSSTDTAAWWNCVCDCGTKKVVKGGSLAAKTSLSCGCLHKEIVAEAGRAKKTHGETNTRLYRVWSGMKARCYDENQPAYKNYGGRGISICAQWRNSYEAFRNWAIAAGYESELTIERIDVNGNYCPENCKFITMKEQSRNKRNTIWITAWGEKKRIFEWLQDARCVVPSYRSLINRINKGWTSEDAISRPFVSARFKLK